MTPALSRARAAVLAEARLPRPPGWRQSVAVVCATLVGLLGLITGAGVAAGAISPEVLRLHLPAMLPVLAVALLAGLAAFVPGARRVRLAAAALAGSAAVLLVALRVPSQPLSSAPWLCTVSHVGVAVVPGLITLVLLRRSAFTLLRSVVAGLAVGACGAFVGELVCEQGPVHVLAFHLPAWAFSTAMVAWLSARLTRRSFAP